MENQNTSGSIFSLNFDMNTKQHMKKAAAVAGVAAILSIAGVVLSIINFFVTSNRPPQQLEGYNNSMVSGTAMASNIFSIAITTIINVALFYFLNRFAKLTKTGIDDNNQPQISGGLRSLGIYFAIIGVIIIVLIAIIVVVIAAAGLGSR
jgi:small-conductance mechanosensitive channel